MTTEEGNKLIAEFITDEPEVLAHDLKKAGTLESMHYHDDWNCLMPVVEKIWNISGNRSSLFYFEYENELISSYEDYTTNIMDCWNAVVAFIQWYNANKNNTVWESSQDAR